MCIRDRVKIHIQETQTNVNVEHWACVVYYVQRDPVIVKTEKYDTWIIYC